MQIPTILPPKDLQPIIVVQDPGQSTCGVAGLCCNCIIAVMWELSFNNIISVVNKTVVTFKTSWATRDAGNNILAFMPKSVDELVKEDNHTPGGHSYPP